MPVNARKVCGLQPAWWSYWVYLLLLDVQPPSTFFAYHLRNSAYYTLAHPTVVEGESIRGCSIFKARCTKRIASPS